MNINFNYYFNNPRNISILIYVLIALFILYLKPEVMFQDNYKVKKLGIGENNTIFPYYIFSILLSIFLYYFVNLYFIRN